jgi:signal peptidase II
MNTRLQKAWKGMLFVAFFFFLCQGARSIVTGWLESAYFSCNAWGAFSLPFSPVVLFFLIIVAFSLFLSGWWQSAGFSEEWPWLLLVVGGASNFFERVAYECVTDYVFLWRFPAFNLADALITIGAALILWRTLIRKSSSAA